MRITENRLTALAGNGLARGMNQLTKAARQLETGMAVEKPSDDPTAWAAAARNRARATVTDAYGQGIATARERLTETEGALSSVGASLSRARELMTQLSNGQLDSGTRQVGAAELRDLRTQILADLDRRGADGDALFGAGSRDAFSAGGAYQGGAAGRSFDVGDGHTVTTGIVGSNVSASLDILTQAADAVEAGDMVAVRGFLDPIVRAHEEAIDARSLVGDQMNALDSAEAARLSLSDTLGAEHQRLVGADPIEAASALARAQLAVEGARQVASSITQTLRSSG